MAEKAHRLWQSSENAHDFQRDDIMAWPSCANQSFPEELQLMGALTLTASVQDYFKLNASSSYAKYFMGSCAGIMRRMTPRGFAYGFAIMAICVASLWPLLADDILYGAHCFEHK